MKFVVEQLTRPRGRMSGLAAVVLNISNRSINHDAVEVLNPKPRDRVVDIGFGGGAGLNELLRNPLAAVTGVEPSMEMIDRARRSLERAIRSERLELRMGGVDDLPAGDGEFDGAITVNTVYFWTDCRHGFSEVLRVLRPGAAVVIGMERGGTRLFAGREVDGRRLNPLTVEQTSELLVEVGFEGVSVLEGPRGRVLIRARRPAAGQPG